MNKAEIITSIADKTRLSKKRHRGYVSSIPGNS